MGETIESMINVLKSQIEFLKDKVKYNNLCSRGSLDQFKNLDKEEKERVIYILGDIKINAEHYINKIKE